MQSFKGHFFRLSRPLVSRSAAEARLAGLWHQCAEAQSFALPSGFASQVKQSTVPSPKEPKVRRPIQSHLLSFSLSHLNSSFCEEAGRRLWLPKPQRGDAELAVLRGSTLL